MKIKNKITIRAEHYTKQSVWNRKNHAKYDTKSTEEKKKSQSTGHTDSSDSINRITQQKYKIKKTFSQRYYNSSRPSTSSGSRDRNPQRNSLNHHHHPQNHNSCGLCGAKGHEALECRRSRKVLCSKCSIKGHFPSMCKTKSAPRNTHSQHRRPTENIHQVADNTDSNNDIKPSPALGNNSGLEEDIYVFRIKGQWNLYNIKVHHSNLPVIIDSGSPLNILDEKLYINIKPSLPLAASTTKIFPYGSKQPLPLLGTFKATVTANRQQTTAKFYITKGSSSTLQGKKTAKYLHLLRVGQLETAFSIH